MSSFEGGSLEELEEYLGDLTRRQLEEIRNICDSSRKETLQKVINLCEAFAKQHGSKDAETLAKFMKYEAFPPKHDEKVRAAFLAAMGWM